MKTSDRLINILCVDDEVNILKSLKRVLRREQFALFFAINGNDALAILDNHKIDIVVTDMRMPHMTGDVLLSKINEKWPLTKKVLLSGFTDRDALTNALNSGGVDYFIEKPWDNCALVERLVCIAQEVISAKHEQLRNFRLKQFFVKAKTADKNTNAISPETCNSFNHLASFIQVHPKISETFAKCVAQTSEELANLMELNQKQVKTVSMAAYLCQLGLIGLEDQALKPYKTLSGAMQNVYRSQVSKAEKLLDGLPSLEGVKRIIVNQFKPVSEQECETKILAVARDYWLMRMGKWQDQKLSSKQAGDELFKFQGICYDPSVINVFEKWLQASELAQTNLLSINDLLPNMVLDADLNNKTGAMLLPKGHTLTQSCVDRLKKIESSIGSELKVCIP